MTLSKWLRWENGRQDSGYGKLLLAQSKSLKFDFYLLRIPVNGFVPRHIDPAVDGFEHHRVNITLNKSCPNTGMVMVEGPAKTWLNKRIMRFRPDLYFHSMTPVDCIWCNHMYILSFGWLRKQG